jgi:hypothetical protein
MIFSISHSYELPREIVCSSSVYQNAKSGYIISKVRRFYILTHYYHPQNVEDPVLHLLYVKYIAPHKDTLPFTHLEGCQRVCSRQKYVYIHFLEFLEDKRKKLKCEVTIVPGAFLTVTKSIALRRNSPYLGLFRHRWVTLKNTKSDVLQIQFPEHCVL